MLNQQLKWRDVKEKDLKITLSIPVSKHGHEDKMYKNWTWQNDTLWGANQGMTWTHEG